MVEAILIELRGLIPCVIIKRSSTFRVEVEVEGKAHIAYINNTGRLRGLLERGRLGYCLPSSTGKADFRLVGVIEEGGAALIDTRLQEKSFEALVERGLIPWLGKCSIIGRAPRVGDHRLDYALDCEGKRVLVELKSAVMNLGNGRAGYPDAPTKRGKEQLAILAEETSRGMSAFVIFVAGIPRASGFQLYCCADPGIEAAAKRAVVAGVEFKSINVYLDPERGVVAGGLDLPLRLECDWDICTNRYDG